MNNFNILNLIKRKDLVVRCKIFSEFLSWTRKNNKIENYEMFCFGKLS